jgi:hypothetical protein
MRNEEIRTPGAGTGDGPRPSVDPDLPSLGAVLIGSVLFLTGGMLMLSVVGIPFGILLFAAGLGLMLEPRRNP